MFALLFNRNDDKNDIYRYLNLTDGVPDCVIDFLNEIEINLKTYDLNDKEKVKKSVKKVKILTSGKVRKRPNGGNRGDFNLSS